MLIIDDTVAVTCLLKGSYGGIVIFLLFQEYRAAYLAAEVKCAMLSSCKKMQYM